jgi:hypothetical protein
MLSHAQMIRLGRGTGLFTSFAMNREYMAGEKFQFSPRLGTKYCICQPKRSICLGAPKSILLANTHFKLVKWNSSTPLVET